MSVSNGSMETATRELSSKILNLQESYGSESVDLILKSLSLEGMNQLGEGLCLIISSLIILILYRFFKKKWDESRRRIDMGEHYAMVEGWVVFTILTLAGSILTFCLGLSRILTISTWYAIFDPKIYAAYLVARQMISL